MQREAAAGFRDVAAVLEQQRAAAEEAAAGARQDVRNLHLELVRQFHVQQVCDPLQRGHRVRMLPRDRRHASEEELPSITISTEPRGHQQDVFVSSCMTVTCHGMWA